MANQAPCSSRCSNRPSSLLVTFASAGRCACLGPADVRADARSRARPGTSRFCFPRRSRRGRRRLVSLPLVGATLSCVALTVEYGSGERLVDRIVGSPRQLPSYYPANPVQAEPEVVQRSGPQPSTRRYILGRSGRRTTAGRGMTFDRCAKHPRGGHAAHRPWQFSQSTWETESVGSGRSTEASGGVAESPALLSNRSNCPMTISS